MKVLQTFVSVVSLPYRRVPHLVLHSEKSPRAALAGWSPEAQGPIDFDVPRCRQRLHCMKADLMTCSNPGDSNGAGSL
jgi:hypothetical protein